MTNHRLGYSVTSVRAHNQDQEEGHALEHIIFVLLDLYSYPSLRGISQVDMKKEISEIYRSCTY